MRRLQEHLKFSPREWYLVKKCYFLISGLSLTLRWMWLIGVVLVKYGVISYLRNELLLISTSI